jgi:hypothetical protein
MTKNSVGRISLLLAAAAAAITALAGLSLSHQRFVVNTAWEEGRILQYCEEINMPQWKIEPLRFVFIGSETVDSLLYHNLV